MKLNLAKVKSKNPCTAGLEWYIQNPSKTVEECIEKLIKAKHLNWANWGLTRIFSQKQNIQYSIFAAEQVLTIYEEKYPEDQRPRNAIKAAKAYLKNPSKKNKEAASSAAASASAAWSAAYAARASAAAADAAYASAAASASAAWSAASAAWSAASAASAAASAAWSAARADAASAAWSAAYAAAVREEIFIKILKYGIKILLKQIHRYLDIMAGFLTG